MKSLIIAIRLMMVLTLVCGVIYPALVTAISQALFFEKANGSLIKNAQGEIIGSELLAQKFIDARYFWPRPSAGNYATVASAASNKGPTSADLKKSIEERRANLKSTSVTAEIPPDMLFASGSGLDPHVSKEGARFQVNRIAAIRKFNDAQKASLYATIEQMVEGRTWGIWGEERVNVLRLNLALDRL